MQIEHRQVGGVTVALLSGRVDSSVADDVTAQLDRLVNAGATRLVVNLKEVSYISSAGLRSIIVAAKLTRSLNGDMRLCEPNALVSKNSRCLGPRQSHKDRHARSSISGSSRRAAVVRPPPSPGISRSFSRVSGISRHRAALQLRPWR